MRSGSGRRLSAHRPGRIARRLVRAPARLYDWNAGWLLGHRFLRLTHVGRRSGRRRFQPVCRVLDEREAEAVLADYQRRNRWLAPVVRRVLSWLVGWRYDGGDDARRRLVHELPLVELRPREPAAC
jgi:hypothetical protein